MIRRPRQTYAPIAYTRTLVTHARRRSLGARPPSRRRSEPLSVDAAPAPNVDQKGRGGQEEAEVPSAREGRM